MSKHVICTDIHGASYKASIDELIWRPSVYGVIIRDGTLLTPIHFGKINLPGGGIEPNETIAEALVREVKEETGVLVRPLHLLDVTDQFFAWKPKTGKVQFYHTLLLYYACEYVTGELSINGFDEDEKDYAVLAEWTLLSTLHKGKLAGTHDWRPLVNDYAAKR
jgi:ADP-ribose pyrophosphatase YjhB (NUDIX family)